ncbi:hypothetical protein [Streptomyces geranii]|uniref:hypothetical protein n=1 Tax=Streptomyces geranii TaxID=2058923 RepID=UPI000D039B75|nr:hypothetical protein [Streptomyces geranii]
MTTATRLTSALTPEAVRTYPRIDQAGAERLVEHWHTAYPAMRTILDTVITAQRRAERPTVDIPRLERVRRELGQVDRGTHRVCTRSEPFFSPTTAGWLVRDVIDITHVGHPQAAAIYRLAAELADLSVEDQPPGAERTDEEGL